MRAHEAGRGVARGEKNINQTAQSAAPVQPLQAPRPQKKATRQKNLAPLRAPRPHIGCVCTDVRIKVSQQGMLLAALVTRRNYQRPRASQEPPRRFQAPTGIVEAALKLVSVNSGDNQTQRP